MNYINKKRVAVIGIGSMGLNHVRILKNLSDTELVAVVDKKFEDKSNLIDNTSCLSSLDELIDQQIDYCVISTPTSMHEEIAQKIIAAKINVLIEKPLASTFASAKRISEKANFNNVIGAVGHIERHNAAIKQAKMKIESGELGEIYQISTRRQGPYPFRISDVGVVKDLASHDVDIVRWITGSNYEYVSAHAAFKSGKSHEDLIAISAVLENSIVVNHVVNWLSPLKERKVIITAEKGTLVVDTLRADLTYYENGKIDISQSPISFFRGVTQGDIHVIAFEKPEPLLIEHLDFIKLIDEKKSDIATLAEGTEILRVTEAVIKSYQNKETIKI